MKEFNAWNLKVFRDWEVRKTIHPWSDEKLTLTNDIVFKLFQLKDMKFHFAFDYKKNIVFNIWRCTVQLQDRQMFGTYHHMVLQVRPEIRALVVSAFNGWLPIFQIRMTDIIAKTMIQTVIIFMYFVWKDIYYTVIGSSWKVCTRKKWLWSRSTISRQTARNLYNKYREDGNN